MRTLGLIAIGGLGIGIASLSLAYALGGRDLHRLPFELASSCGDGAKGGPSVRQLAWGNGDSIELSLPGTVTFRGRDCSGHSGRTAADYQNIGRHFIHRSRPPFRFQRLACSFVDDSDH